VLHLTAARLSCCVRVDESVSQMPSTHPGGQLPDSSYVELTEAITWILNGCSRTDGQFNKERAQTERKNRERWGKSEGPAWLKPCLERLSTGGMDVAEQDDSDPAARRWLQRSGLTAAVAYDDVCAELDRQELAAVRQARLYSLLFKGAVDQRFMLLGLLQESNSKRPPVDFAPIPWQYFLRPAFHAAGKGYSGNGEIGPIPATGEEVLRSVFGDTADVDRRSTYLNVRISRGDAENLKAEFDHSERILSRSRAAVFKSKANAESQCQTWLEGEMRASPHASPKAKSEWLTEALSKFSGRLSKRAFLNRCWPNAIKSTGAEAWRTAGRKLKR
jgi:hypothetical protein